MMNKREHHERLDIFHTTLNTEVNRARVELNGEGGEDIDVRNIYKRYCYDDDPYQAHYLTGREDNLVDFVRDVITDSFNIAADTNKIKLISLGESPNKLVHSIDTMINQYVHDTAQRLRDGLTLESTVAGMSGTSLIEEDWDERRSETYKYKPNSCYDKKFLDIVKDYMDNGYDGRGGRYDHFNEVKDFVIFKSIDDNTHASCGRYDTDNFVGRHHYHDTPTYNPPPPQPAPWDIGAPDPRGTYPTEESVMDHIRDHHTTFHMIIQNMVSYNEYLERIGISLRDMISDANRRTKYILFDRIESGCRGVTSVILLGVIGVLMHKFTADNIHTLYSRIHFFGYDLDASYGHMIPSDRGERIESFKRAYTNIFKEIFGNNVDRGNNLSRDLKIYDNNDYSIILERFSQPERNSKHYRGVADYEYGQMNDRCVSEINVASKDQHNDIHTPTGNIFWSAACNSTRHEIHKIMKAKIAEDAVGDRIRRTLVAKDLLRETYANIAARAVAGNAAPQQGGFLLSYLNNPPVMKGGSRYLNLINPLGLTN